MRSKLIKNHKKLIINLKLIFPNIDTKKIETNLKTKRQFYIKKRLTENEKQKLWELGEKGIIFEPYQAEFTQTGIYSAIL